jgi:hypothetical protein
VFTGTWLIDFQPSGRAVAFYGSNPGDSGHEDEGTVNFKALLEAVTKTERKNAREPGDVFQVSIQYEGETSTTGFTLVNDSVIRQTLVELEDKWKPDPLGQRFFEFKTTSPIILKKKESSGPAPALYRETGTWFPGK